MAQQYVTGPAHIFVGIGRSGAPLYLGTAERWPRISLRPSYEPTFNDLGGKVPFDMAFEGEEGFVSADISRWNEPVYAALASRPRPSGSRGTNTPGDVGTLLVAEGQAYRLWVQFPYAAKPAFAGMPPGYRFHAAYLAGPDDLEPLGTTPRKVRLLWHCLRVFLVGTALTTALLVSGAAAAAGGGGARAAMAGAANAAAASGGTFLLYDHNMTGLPAID